MEGAIRGLFSGLTGLGRGIFEGIGNLLEVGGSSIGDLLETGANVFDPNGNGWKPGGAAPSYPTQPTTGPGFTTWIKENWLLATGIGAGLIVLIVLLTRK